jgi:hypothetical protein
MSLIVGLNKSKKTICFSNGYAALKCGVSKSTITRTISKFVEEGFISCYFKADGRIIHLIKTPVSVEDSIDCGLEPMTTPPTHDDYTPTNTDYTPSSQELTPLITLTTNNIDYNIIDNIDNIIDDNIEDNIGKNKISIEEKTKYEELVSNFLKDGFSNEEAKQYAKDALVFL